VVLAEGIAQDLEVVQVCIVGGCVELDTSHGHVDWKALAGVDDRGDRAGKRTEDAVVDGAERRTGCEVSMHVMGDRKGVEDTRYRIVRHG
jgi:hypothetical protein